MAGSLKKDGFLSPTLRHFTARAADAWTLIDFRDSEEGFARPGNWSAEATSLFAETTAQPVPSPLKVVEENTVPSWLWRHEGIDKGCEKETSAAQVFDRVAGGATYQGWKAGLFANEAAARAFFDETRYALAQRFIALDLEVLAGLGTDWAYGEKTAHGETRFETPAAVDISNATIDSVIGSGSGKAMPLQWQELVSSAKQSRVTARFSDIAADWGGVPPSGVKIVIDLAALQRDDKPIDIEMLRHLVRLAVLLCDLHGAGEKLAIGFCNLASLLLSLALPYDSAAARAYAAAIAAVITAEAYAASAELAGLRGIGQEFGDNREAVLRNLRNRRRAAYGDRNDYEKISVLPTPLILADGPDLALAAAARKGWDEAIDLAQINGLRHAHMTALFSFPALTLFMESTAEGVAPLRALISLKAEGEDIFLRAVHPGVIAALARLGYGASESKAIIRHIGGHGTLERAPGINHAALATKGFDAEALKRIENYLPYVHDIRLAFTPWIAGEDFCRDKLKISAAKIADPRFELLKHLGFTNENIGAANAFCYGHGTARNAHALRMPHISVFTRDEEMPPDARIKMAAAVQSFVSGDVGMALVLPHGTPAEKSEKLLLSAWRQGLKSLTLEYVPADTASNAGRAARASTPFLHAKTPALPARKARPKAASKLLGFGKSKPSPTEEKRR